MTQHIDPCDTARNNVLAAALALQQCTKTAASIVAIPGTGRFIAIGTRAEVARLLKLDTAATTQASTAQAEPTDADRYRWLKERFTGYDFYWLGTPPYEAEVDKGKCVIVFECGQDFEAGRDFEKAIDAALRAGDTGGQADGGEHA